MAVDQPVEIPPTPVGGGGFQAGQQLLAQTTVNVRRMPGTVGKPDGDVFAMLAQGTAVTITGGPDVRDGLTWWRIAVAMADGSTQEGWAAESVNGISLLGTMVAPTSRGLKRADPQG